MTVPLDSAMSLAAGHIFALTGAEAIAADPELERECLNRGRVFTALVMVPVGGYFLVRWPDWSWHYLPGKHAKNPALGVLGVSLYAAMHEVGFRNVARLARKGKTRAATAYTVASILLLPAMGAAFLKRLIRIGDHEEHLAGGGRLVFFNGTFLLSLLVLGTLAAMPFLYVLKRNLMADRWPVGVR